MVQFEVTLDANNKPIIKFAYNTSTTKLDEKVLKSFIDQANNIANKITLTLATAEGVTTATLNVVPV